MWLREKWKEIQWGSDVSLGCVVIAWVDKMW